MGKIKLLRCSLLAFAIFFFLLSFFVESRVEWLRKFCSFMAVFSVFISLVELIDTAIDTISSPKRSKTLDNVVKKIRKQINDTKEHAKNIRNELDELDDDIQRKYSKEIRRLKGKLDDDIDSLIKEQRDKNGKKYPPLDMKRRRKFLAKYALWTLLLGVFVAFFHAIVYELSTESATFISLAMVCVSFSLKLLDTKELATIMRFVQTRKARKCDKDCSKTVYFIKSIVPDR